MPPRLAPCCFIQILGPTAPAWRRGWHGMTICCNKVSCDALRVHSSATQDTPHCPRRSHPSRPTSDVSILGDKLYPLVSCGPPCPFSALASPSCASCDPAWQDASMFAPFLLARPCMHSLCATCCQTLGTMLFHLMGPASPRTTVEMGEPCVAHASHLLCPQCTLEPISPSSWDAGRRRAQTGPNNSGHRLLLRWLGHNGIEPSFASDRNAWNHLGNQWLARFGLWGNYLHHNTWHASPDAHPPQNFRAIQGCFHGQQIITGWLQTFWTLDLPQTGSDRGLAHVGANFPGSFLLISRGLK